MTKRGQPGLNRRPLDLQSNALPLSYIPYIHTLETDYFQHIRSYNLLYNDYIINVRRLRNVCIIFCINILRNK